MPEIKNTHHAVERFTRDFYRSRSIISKIGEGGIGGKATGLVTIHDILHAKYPGGTYDAIDLSIPKMVVIATDIFEQFIERNQLDDLLNDPEASDKEIIGRFMSADLPVEIVGDIRALISEITTPLAIRSSSLLEDDLFEPFAGVYSTKMIPNNQPDVDTRFRKLVEAIKFVYASTWFGNARNYHRAVGKDTRVEKMAVIIQEVVGRRHIDRFYPDISGVARSYNFYPMGSAKPEHGIVNLASGLGKTIVDGGISWSFSPAFPSVTPPFGSIRDQLDLTQTRGWAVNMGPSPEYDPFNEAEYLVQYDLREAEYDGALDYIASTFLPENDRVVSGVGRPGPRIINFAPILKDHRFQLTELLSSLLIHCETQYHLDVEIEFAATISSSGKFSFALLQVRPMVVSREQTDITDEDITSGRTLATSTRALGNGVVDNITDIVFVDPDSFAAANTPAIAAEISTLNRTLVEENRPYLLIGFGRWGSSEPWLGIPVEWSQISGARAIIEATLPNMNVELSQGTHFFHNMTSFRIPYFQVNFNREKIDWDWLRAQPVVQSSQFVHHVRVENPLTIKVDGRISRGVILHE